MINLAFSSEKARLYYKLFAPPYCGANNSYLVIILYINFAPTSGAKLFAFIYISKPNIIKIYFLLHLNVE